MYVDDFHRLVRQHLAPYAHLDFHVTRHGPERCISILDYHYPRRRRKQVITGNASWDWYMASFICNFETVAGEVPMESRSGEYIYADDLDNFTHQARWRVRPGRGVKDTLKLLLKDGTIVPGSELDRVLGIDSRSVCTNINRILYVR